MTCTGTLFMCLGQEDAADLRGPLRASEANDLLYAAIDEAIARKPKGHDFVIDRTPQASGAGPPHERHRRLSRPAASPPHGRSCANFPLRASGGAAYLTASSTNPRSAGQSE